MRIRQFDFEATWEIKDFRIIPQIKLWYIWLKNQVISRKNISICFLVVLITIIILEEKIQRY